MASSKKKKRSTTCKMLCAMFLTALVIENGYLHSIPVYADFGLDDFEFIWAVAGPTIQGCISSAAGRYTSITPAEADIIFREAGILAASLDYGAKKIDLQDAGYTVKQSLQGSTIITGYQIINDGTTDKVSVGSIIVEDNCITLISELGSIRCIVAPIYLDQWRGSVSPGGSDYYVTQFLPTNNDPSGQFYFKVSGFDSSNYTSSSPRFVNNFPAMSMGFSTKWSVTPAIITSTNPKTMPYSGNNVYTWYITGGSFLRAGSSGYTVNTDGGLDDLINEVYNSCVADYGQELVDENWIPIEVPEPVDGSINDLVLPPGIPSASFNAPEIPEKPLPQKMLDGAGFWFTQFNNLLDGLGVKWIVIIFMCVALLMTILKL